MPINHATESENIEEIEPEKEELDFNKPDFVFIPKEFHEWRQQGYYLICLSCEVKHAIWIGENKVLVGLDEKGQPILKTRQELGMA